jgi:hypothetical protein
MIKSILFELVDHETNAIGHAALTAICGKFFDLPLHSTIVLCNGGVDA